MDRLLESRAAARRHRRPAPVARQIRRDVHADRNQRSARQPARRSRARRGLRRPDHRHRADGYAKGVRFAGRPVQRQRAADSRREPERQQARHAEYGERHRSRRRHSPVGIVVPAVVPEQARRREDRSAKYRPGIHHQHVLGAVPQHDVRLARAAVVRHAVGRPGVSAVRSRRARARPDHAFVDRVGRRVRTAIRSATTRTT